MQKIGYGIIVSLYLVSFSIGKDIVAKTDMSVFEEPATKQETVLESIANGIADSIGMNDFFDSLSKGL